jgi:hypothetical protein
MRTTLDIADDVLFAAKEVARREKKSVGQIISELARQAFNQGSSGTNYLANNGDIPAQLVVSERLSVYGIEPLASRGGVVSNELIDRLRDVEGI